MAFMLKVRWDIAAGKAAEFRSNQQALCRVMLEHPGVMTYHVDYPGELVSEWIEIYANDDVFRAHLANDKGKAPLAAVTAACDKVTCRCFGDPGPESRKVLDGFGATYHDTAPDAFVVNPRADRTSPV